MHMLSGVNYDRKVFGGMKVLGRICMESQKRIIVGSKCGARNN